MTDKAVLQKQLLAVLPQTQCTRCGFPDCSAYAQAIAQGDAAINQCPPGGEIGIARLAALTHQAVMPLNEAHGKESVRTVAIVDENWCIGCTLCIKACPVDAIVGSNKLMHTVIETACTGCELCVPVCPVDCISLENVSGSKTGWNAWSAEQAGSAAARFKARQIRLSRLALEAEQKRVSKAEKKLAHLATDTHEAGPEVLETRRAIIEAVLARARAKKATD